MSTIHSNLGTEFARSEHIVTSARERKCGDRCANVGSLERAISGIVGGSLVAAGIARRSGLGAGLALVGAGLLQRAVTGRCMLYQTLGVNTAQSGRGHSPALGVRAKHGRKHQSTIVILRPAEELFDTWRSLSALPKFFDHLISVVDLGDGRSHWVARGPLGQRVEWDAEIHNQRPGEMIAWRSIPGSDLDTAGSIHFEPSADNSRTIVTVSMKYDPPAGKLGSAIADWLGQSVDDELDDGLRCFKQLAEAGEVATTEGQSRGTCAKF